MTLTATFVAGIHNDNTPPYILYWDSASSTMQVGAWTTQGGNANNDNQLFFQFGSVVGFTNVVAATGTAWPGMSTIMFNPTETATSSLTWTTIPNWNGSDTTDGYISSSSYHTIANVQAGRGDPCKLVGLTKAQIQSGLYDNETYRLPTSAENGAYSSPSYIAGNGWTGGTTPTAGIYTSVGIATTFLPASGSRNYSDGSTNYVGNSGNWWSSRADSSLLGFDLYFDNVGVSTAHNFNARYGFAVRCVAK